MVIALSYGHTKHGCTTDCLGWPRTAPDQIFVNPVWSEAVLGVLFFFFLLRQSKFVDSSSSRQHYKLLRHRHGIIMDGAGATTK